MTESSSLPVRLLDRLFSGQEDPLALGVCRAAIAGILCLSSLLHLGSVAEYFSDASMINGRFAALAFPSRWSLFLGFGGEQDGIRSFAIVDPLAVQAVWTIGTVALGCWALGLYTRVSSVLGMLLWISMYGRNPLLYAFPDQLGLFLGMLLALTPAGRGFSLDARWRGKAGTVPIWCRRILQVQLAIVYTATGLEKTGDTWHVDGTAIYYTLTNPYNRHFDAGGLFAWMQPWLLRPMTFTVLAWELSFGVFLVWVWVRDLAGGRVPGVGWRIPDLRWLYLGFGVAMHVGIQIGVYVVLFSPLMVGAYVSFLSAEEVRGLGRVVRDPSGWMRGWWRRRIASKQKTDAAIPPDRGVS